MSPNRLLLSAEQMSRAQTWRRWLLRSVPGWVLIVGLVLKLTALVLALVPGATRARDAVDVLGGLALMFVAGYAVVKLAVWARRRLLWRVRRRLILSYIFVGLVPVVLVIGFFLLAGLLLSLNVSSFLVQSNIQSLGEQARFIAESLVIEAEHDEPPALLERRIEERRAQLSDRFAMMSMAFVPVANLTCDGLAASRRATSLPQPERVGPWQHLSPPDRLARWIRCDGFSGLILYRVVDGTSVDYRLVMRAAAVPQTRTPGWAAIVDVPLTAAVEARVHAETGVQLGAISPPSAASDATTFPVADGRPLESRPAHQTLLDDSGFGGSWVTSLNVHDWTTGGVAQATVSTQFNISEVTARLTTGSERVSQTIRLALALVGVLFLTVQFVALVIGFALAKQITGAVHDLFTGTQHLRDRDFNYHIPVRASDQLGELADSFNLMTGEVTKLLRENAARARMEQEMMAAREIQQKLLPSGSLRLPGVSITAFCEPAREVAGDYFDFLTISPTRLGVLIADVSGKGLPAGLYMAQLKVLVQSLVRTHPSPRDFLKAVNRVVADNIDAKSFITMSYAVIDLESRTMSFARAGHCPLVRVPGSQPPGLRRSEMFTPDGLVLGLKIDNGEMFDAMLQEVTVPLGPGDLIVFFTDGISETMNPEFDCYGEQRLAQVLEQYAHLSFEQLRSFIFADLRGFAGPAEQHDDMTMVLLRMDEAGDSATTPTAAASAAAGH